MGNKFYLGPCGHNHALLNPGICPWCRIDRLEKEVVRLRGPNTKEYKGIKVFEGYMARLFIEAVKRARTQTVTWKADRADKNGGYKTETLEDVILSSDIAKELSAPQYTRFGDLKHWGLLYQRPEWWHQGIYVLTGTAKRFLSENVTVSREVTIGKGQVVHNSDKKISLRQALGKDWNDIADWISEWRRGHREPGLAGVQMGLELGV